MCYLFVFYIQTKLNVGTEWWTSDREWVSCVSKIYFGDFGCSCDFALGFASTLYVRLCPVCVLLNVFFRFFFYFYFLLVFSVFFCSILFLSFAWTPSVYFDAFGWLLSFCFSFVRVVWFWLAFCSMVRRLKNFEVRSRVVFCVCSRCICTLLTVLRFSQRVVSFRRFGSGCDFPFT